MTKLNERDDYALILQAIGRGYFKLRDRLLESGLVKQVCKAVMRRQKSNFYLIRAECLHLLINKKVNLLAKSY